MKFIILLFKRLIQQIKLNTAIMEAKYRHLSTGRQYIVKANKGKFHVIAAVQVRAYNHLVKQAKKSKAKQMGAVDVREFKNDAVYITR